jgi:hypothetical protein
MYVCLTPRLRIHTKCGLRFLPVLHTSYIRDSWSAPLNEDVFDVVLTVHRRYYVEIKCQLDATDDASSWHFIST